MCRQSVVGASHAEIVQALQSSNDITLEVDDAFPAGSRRSLEEPANREMPNGNGNGAAAAAAAASAPAAAAAKLVSGPVPPVSATTTCRVHRSHGQRFGMKLLENEDQAGSGVTVNAVDPAGAAAMGGLKAGDRFYSIDDTVVWTASHTQILDLFQNKEDMDIKARAGCDILGLAPFFNTSSV